jgi:glyoxylase-like metal-dependent hydrolase (beta-lactamase superfamily II)/ferredoxin
MARLADRLPENVDGQFFVDASCIDCDACRQLAPTVFACSARDQSYVAAQPRSEAERRRALMALVTCPTSSIGTTPKLDPREAIAAFPELVEDNVYHCGFHAEASYGAASYLIVRKDGNVLVDSPRAVPQLLERIQALGGVRWMFLSHRDDVADHARFATRFGCERIIHAADAGALGALERGVRQVHGEAPLELADDLLLVPTPGHTRGSMVLLHRNKFLFTGDHLWASEYSGRLEASRGVCWYSWPEQVRSLVKLRALEFEWVLPGHGRRLRASSAAAMQRELEQLLVTVGAPARSPTR